MTADINIWQSFLQGDKLSFEQLMQLHYKSLFSYGSKYSENAELVKDSIQELFIGLWDRRENLSTNVNPRAYLIASLRRSLHRKIQSENRFLKYKDEVDSSNNFNFEFSIEQKMIDSESLQHTVKKIGVSVSALPKRQKEVIYLKFFQDLSRDEIATIMNINAQTVSNLLQLALKKLRVDLNSILTIVIIYVIPLLCFLL